VAFNGGYRNQFRPVRTGVREDSAATAMPGFGAHILLIEMPQEISHPTI